MAARKRKSISADGKLTVTLEGWPAERRMLSTVEASWFINIKFQVPGKNTKVLTYFQSSDYDAVLEKYNMVRAMAET